MGFRNIVVSNPAQLHIKDGNLQVTVEGDTYTVPTEDISVLIIENRNVLLSSSVLSVLAQNNISVVTCDESHLPVSINTAFQSHSRQKRRIDEQIGLTEPFKKRVWQRLISKKIENQAVCLNLLGHTIGYKDLLNLSKLVNSGDTDNIEGNAARKYFRYIWGIDFTRDKENSINAALNYGYAIIRADIARTLVAYGFIPSLGINHRSEYNNFNLADDFIEPFRPYVDLWVAKNVFIETEFDKECKHSLVSLLKSKVIIGNEIQELSTAIEKVIISFVTAISQDDYNKISLPDLVNFFEKE